MTDDSSPQKVLVIGSDHIGFPLKEAIKAYLQEQGFDIQDVGAHSAERTDYPRYAEQVAQAILSGSAPRGILICGTGVGMSIAANKIAGIRAVVCSEPYSAAYARMHNDTNVLAFGSRVVALGMAQMIVDAWLQAEYEGGRHNQRLDQIAKLETEFLSQRGAEHGRSCL